MERGEEVHDFGFEKTGLMKSMIVKKARGRHVLLTIVGDIPDLLLLNPFFPSLLSVVFVKIFLWHD